MGQILERMGRVLCVFAFFLCRRRAHLLMREGERLVKTEKDARTFPENILPQEKQGAMGIPVPPLLCL